MTNSLYGACSENPRKQSNRKSFLRSGLALFGVVLIQPVLLQCEHMLL